MNQVHLKTIEAENGSGDASMDVRLLLELGMRRKLEKDDYKREPGAHVSDAGKCPRQLFFSLTGVPKTEQLTLDSYMTLSVGKKAEELYLELLEAAGVKVMTQQRVELEDDGEKIHGTLDLLIEVPDEVRALIPGLDSRELWEIKTKNTRALGWLMKKGGPDKSDGYIKQIRGYLHAAMTGKVPAPTKARGRLVYTAVGATKGEPLFHAWFVSYNEQEAKADLKVLSQAVKGAREGVDPGIPEAFKDRPNFPCGYCDFQRKCFPNGKAE